MGKPFCDKICVGMSSARRTGLLAACIVGLLGALISQPDSTAEAQAPAPAVGEYQYKNYRVGITSWPDAKVKSLPHINLLPNNRFIYGSGDSGYHGDYRVLPGGKVELGTCLGWRGEVTQVPNPELRFKMTDAKAGQGHEWNMERLGAPRPPSPEPPYDSGCKFAFATDRTTTASRVAVLAQTAGGRIIDGEIFLATKRDAPPRDASLWSCLVTNGYPGVEYGEAPVGPAPQPLLVLPDGRFRSRVRGGVNYRWWMLPAGCETPPRQPLAGIATPVGPMEPAASGEKILLACWVQGGVLPDCNGWWLRKP